MRAAKLYTARGGWKAFEINGKQYHKGTVTLNKPGPGRKQGQKITTLTQEIQEGGEPITGASLLAWRRLDAKRFEVIVLRPDEVVEPESPARQKQE